MSEQDEFEFGWERTDPTEEARRQMLPGMRAELAAAVEAGDPVWTTAEMTAEFEVVGFLAPYVVVRRRSDGVQGTLRFTHVPRMYFGWDPDV